MSSRTNKDKHNNNLFENNEQKQNFGGFPPIIHLNVRSKKIKEFGKLHNDEEIKNIYKLNILNIKNILAV